MAFPKLFLPSMQHFKKYTIFKFISIILFAGSLSFAQTGNELDLLNAKLGKAKISKDTLNITRTYFKLGKYLLYNDITKSFYISTRKYY